MIEYLHAEKDKYIRKNVHNRLRFMNIKESSYVKLIRYNRCAEYALEILGLEENS